MIFTKTFLFFLSLLFLMGCASNSVNPDGQICFKTTGSELVITNRTDQTLHRAVFATNLLPTMNWAAACTTEYQLLPNQSVRIRFADVFGYQTGESVTVFWWGACTNAAQDGVRFASHDSVQSVNIETTAPTGQQCEAVQ